MYQYMVSTLYSSTLGILCNVGGDLNAFQREVLFLVQFL